MPFVGLITDKKEETEFTNYLDNKIYKNTIIINRKNINNVKNIKFDTVLINKKISNKSDALKKILSNSNNLVVNSDIDTDLSIIANSNSNVITFGFNPKSTVTASSLENDDAFICVQRNIKNVNNEIIEPQEIKVTKFNQNDSPYIIMGVEILTLLYDL